MRNRVSRGTSAIVLGCVFQFGGCNSDEIADIIAGNIRDTVVDVGTFVIESATDEALGLE